MAKKFFLILLLIHLVMGDFLDILKKLDMSGSGVLNETESEEDLFNDYQIDEGENFLFIL